MHPDHPRHGQKRQTQSLYAIGKLCRRHIHNRPRRPVQRDVTNIINDAHDLSNRIFVVRGVQSTAISRQSSSGSPLGHNPPGQSFVDDRHAGNVGVVAFGERAAAQRRDA